MDVGEVLVAMGVVGVPRFRRLSTMLLKKPSSSDLDARPTALGEAYLFICVADVEVEVKTDKVGVGVGGGVCLCLAMTAGEGFDDIGFPVKVSVMPLMVCRAGLVDVGVDVDVDVEDDIEAAVDAPPDTRIPC